MKLKIVKKTHVVWPVTVNIPQDGGSVTEHKFFARFRRLSEKEFNELSNNGGNTAILKASLTAVGDTEADVEELTDTDKNELLTDTNYRVGLFNSYLRMDAGAAEKNS